MAKKYKWNRKIAKSAVAPLVILETKTTFAGRGLVLSVERCSESAMENKAVEK